MADAKKGRKFERNRKSQSMARYKALSRDKVNKARKVAKHAKKAEKTMRVPRGTARAKRRAETRWVSTEEKRNEH